MTNVRVVEGKATERERALSGVREPWPMYRMWFAQQREREVRQKARANYKSFGICMGSLLSGERSGGKQEQTACPLEYVWVVCSEESGQEKSKSKL